MWKNIPKDYDEYQGFIYLITNTYTNKYYIGQKGFWRIAKLPMLKGRTKKEKERRAKLTGRKRHIRKETDWAKYWGSSEELLDDVKAFGQQNFKREIILCCETKSMLNYFELFFQLQYNVLFDDNSYNRIINIRANANMFANQKDKCLDIVKHFK